MGVVFFGGGGVCQKVEIKLWKRSKKVVNCRQDIVNRTQNVILARVCLCAAVIIPQNGL